MKHGKLFFTLSACLALLLAGGPAWAAKGGIPGKPPPGGEDPPPETPIDDFYFWRWGHMDGPHDSSKSLGISRDGKVAVGTTVVVDFERAWRSDIDWAIATDDAVPPLYNELQVQEDIGIALPPQPSAAFSASDMTCDSYQYDKVNLVLDWCGSKPVGTIDQGTVSYGIEWLLPVLDSVDEGDFLMIPDFGGGLSDMKVKDVSADGVKLVGTGNVKTGPVAFIADTGVVDEDMVPIPLQLTIQDFVTLQTLQTSTAEAVSADGTIIAGYGSTKRANRAFVATVLDMTTDPVTLESTILPMLGGGKFAEAYAMTPEGDVIAGRSDSPKGPVACIWFIDAATGEWVIKPLGSLSKRSKDAAATGVAWRVGAADGDLIVVGRSKSILYPSEALVWTGNPTLEEEEIGYLYDLEYILTKTGVGEASAMGSEWILSEATGISAAGDRIVGWGVNPEGGIEAWVVTGFPFDGPLEDEFTHE